MTGHQAITDKQIWAEIEAGARIHGWGNRRRIKRDIAILITRLCGTVDDCAYEELAGRIDRIWAENAGIRGVMS